MSAQNSIAKSRFRTEDPVKFEFIILKYQVEKRLLSMMSR